jgi:hypothetical protein
MDRVNTSPFDPANLVPKMQRYLDGSLDIATGVLTRDGHTIVLVCVKASPRGCAFFKIDGQYQSPQGEPITRFRAGEVFWRENTRSVRITMEGTVVCQRPRPLRPAWYWKGGSIQRAVPVPRSAR